MKNVLLPYIRLAVTATVVLRMNTACFYTLLIEWILTCSAPVSADITALTAAQSFSLSGIDERRLIEWILTCSAPVSAEMTALIAAHIFALSGMEFARSLTERIRIRETSAPQSSAMAADTAAINAPRSSIVAGTYSSVAA